MGRESPPFFLEVNGWVQLHGIVAITAIVHVQSYLSLRLEYSTLHLHVHVHVHVHVHYTTYYTLTTTVSGGLISHSRPHMIKFGKPPI